MSDPTSDSPFRLLLVDDHVSYRRAIGFMLERESDLRITGQAGTLEEARRVLRAHGSEIDVALLDLDLPDGDGVSLIHELHERNASASVLVLTGSASVRSRAFAVEAGAAAVLHKSVDIPVIADACRRLCAGEALISPKETIDLLREAGRFRLTEQVGRSALERLTEREWEVLRALARGLSDKQLAHQFGVSQRTAQAHVANLLGKLGVDSRMQAVILAARLGAVTIE